MNKSSKSKSANKCRISYLLQSTILRRMLFMWAMLLVTSVIIMAALFMSVSNASYSDYEMENIQRTASTIATIREEYLNGSVSREGMHTLQNSISNVRNCSFYIFRIDKGNLVFSDSAGNFAEEYNSIANPISAYAKKVFSVGELMCDEIVLDGEATLITGAPVMYNGVINSVVIGVRSEDGSRAQEAISRKIIYVIVIGMIPLGIISIILVIINIVLPLTDIAEVAIEMSKGNLNARVKHEEKHGEIGLLARAFNQLSSSLSQNFIQLEQEHSRLVQVVNSSFHGIAVIDAEGRLIQCNPALIELFEKKRHNTQTSLNYSQRLSVVPDEHMWSNFDNVIKTGVGQRVVYPIDNDRVLWITIAPVASAEGDKVGAVGYFQDMTEVERLERTRREYVANVSHELRRPLTSLQGLLEPMRDGLVTDERDKQRYYDIMLHEIQRLSRLISDMMQLSRLQAEDMSLNIEVLNVSDIARDVAEGYRAEIEGGEMSLETAIQPNAIAMADADRVEQILIILLDNAMRFNKPGGSIAIGVKEDAGKVIMTVSDTGCGISADDLPHIFERFYKADKSHGSYGTGLGLSIAKHIIQRLGGEISCESELGKGTVMKATFKGANTECNECEN